MLATEMAMLRKRVGARGGGAGRGGGTREGVSGVPTGRAPLGTVRRAALDPTRSGPVSLARLGERQVTYAQEVTQLARCGAQSGSTEVLYAASWGMSASTFGCRDAAAAQQFLTTMGTVELTELGFRRDADPAAQVSAFDRTTNPGNPNYPYQA